MLGAGSAGIGVADGLRLAMKGEGLSEEDSRSRFWIVVVASGASRVTDAMMLAAARTLADNSPALEDSSASLLPPLTDIRRVAAEIATAVGVQAQRDGVAPEQSDEERRRRVAATQWNPVHAALTSHRG
jgi:malic enzyme